jgi:hypothetical protein
MMNRERVRELEDEIESAIAQTLKQLAPRQNVKPPSRRTCHLMAKAAVAVLEAVEETTD